MRRRAAEKLVSTLLVVTLIGLGAGIYLALSPRHSAFIAAPPASAPSVLAKVTDVSEADLRGFLHNSLGTATGNPAPAEPGVLPFTINGISWSPDGPSVVFVKFGKTNTLCAVGDTIEGWKVVSIEAGKVVFAKDGREASLTMDVRKYDAASPMALAASPVAAQSRSASPVSYKPASGKNLRSMPRAMVAATAPARTITAAQAAAVDSTVAVPRDVADKARTNPESVMEGVKLDPVTVDGKLQGITLSNVTADSYAARFGLAPGDKVVAVNGQPIDSASRVYALYSRYRNDDSVTITLERAGQRRTVLFYAQ